jgi:hypothetical protein
MSYSVDAQGVIRSESGGIVPRDVGSVIYQDFLYWQTHGVSQFDVPTVAEPVADPRLAPPAEVSEVTPSTEADPRLA